MKLLTNLDLNQNQILQASLQNLSTAPTSPAPVEGQMYYNTTSHRAFAYNGTTWIGMDAVGATMTGADIVTAINSATGSLIDDDNLSTNVNSAITNNHTHSNKSTLDTYNQSNTDLTDAVSKKHSQNTDTGTSSATFIIGTSGVKIKNNSGTELQVRNNADNDYADLRVKNLTVDGTTTQINSNEVNIGDADILLNADIVAGTSNSDGGISVKRLMADDTTRKDAQLTFNNTTGKWQTTHGAVTGTLITAQLANKIIAAIGDGTHTDYVITHNLNSRDLVVSIRETASAYGVVYADIAMTSLDTITVSFAAIPTSNQYTVSIVG